MALNSMKIFVSEKFADRIFCRNGFNWTHPSSYEIKMDMESVFKPNPFSLTILSHFGC